MKSLNVKSMNEQFKLGQLFTEHNQRDDIVSAYLVIKESCFEDDDKYYPHIDRILFYCLMDDEDGINVSAGETISFTRDMFIDWDREDNLTQWKVNGEYLNEKLKHEEYERTL